MRPNAMRTAKRAAAHLILTGQEYADFDLPDPAPYTLSEIADGLFTMSVTRAVPMIDFPDDLFRHLAGMVEYLDTLDHATKEALRERATWLALVRGDSGIMKEAEARNRR